MSHYIGGQWITDKGKAFNSQDAVTHETLWTGTVASDAVTHRAIKAAQDAFKSWAALPLEHRIHYLKQFAHVCETHQSEIAQLISQEVGKPSWEADTEVAAVIAKVNISIEAYHNRTGIHDHPEAHRLLRHKPHGVLAVLGPFNFPAHLPNGHIVPALLAGNTVVFKPSTHTPAVAQRMVEMWHEAGLPPGVLNCIQGNAHTAQTLIKSKQVKGVLFTGSYAVGRKIHQSFAGQPEKLLALEMGGNNPLIISSVKKPAAAALHTVLSSYITAGQRCTCARRLIVVEDGSHTRYLDALVKQIEAIRVGHFTDHPQPFMGPVINDAAAKTVLEIQKRWRQYGGESLVTMKRVKRNTPLLSPGLIDMTAAKKREDIECFGPLLQLIRVANIDAAIEEANHTQFGLAAGILSDNPEHFEAVYLGSQAGIVNWNQPLTGASSAAPFGGIGHSGNHRPAAYYAADYCAYPVATLYDEHLKMPTLPPGLKKGASSS